MAPSRSTVLGTCVYIFRSPYTSKTRRNGTYSAVLDDDTYNKLVTRGPATCSIETESPMPVTLISFNIRQEGGIASEQWATASEENSKGCEIERSTNASAWTRIGFVPSLSPQAVSSSRLECHFADPAPLVHRSYCRMKIVDP